MKKISVLFFLAGIIYSCTDHDINNSSKLGAASRDDVMLIAKVQAPTIKSIDGRASVAEVSSIHEEFDDAGAVSMYIINYSTGFIIVAGDTRVSPILAFSDESQFPVNAGRPQGLNDWIVSTKELIEDVRSQNGKQDQRLLHLWDYAKTKRLLDGEKKEQKSGRTEIVSYTYIGDCNNGDSQVTLYTEVMPLFTYNWDQNAGYNNSVTYAGCSATGNGRYWAGCNATATAMVMRYHEYPLGYNWTSMGPNDVGLNSLMNNLGSPSNLNISYSCYTSVGDPARIKSTFSNFGYPLPTYGINNYNYFTVKNDLTLGRPVILNSWRNDGFGGHAWVTTGVREWMYFACSPDPNTPGEWIQTYFGYDAALYMNWGWSGSFNGWYSAYNFNPNGIAYNYHPSMTVGIRKP